MVTLYLGLILVVVVILSCLRAKPKNFPPGPRHWPVLGALLETMKYPSKLYSRTVEMVKRYGRISGFYLGHKGVIFVSGVAEVKEAFNRDDFSQRPTGSIGKMTQSRRHMLGITLAEGSFWKEQRCFTLRHLRDLGFGRRIMESIIHEEVESLIKEMKRLAGPGYRNPICVEDIIPQAMLNVLWQIMSGKRYEFSNPQLKTLIHLVRVWLENLGTFPDLTFFLPRVKKSAASNNQLVLKSVKIVIQEFVSETIEEHKLTLNPDSPRDFIDVYLLEIQKTHTEEINCFSEKQLRAICFDLFIAGTDTTSTSLKFCLLYMLLNPDIQKRIQRDLDKVVGMERLPSLKDRPRLPYIDATIYETLRLGNIVPVIPREASYRKKSYNFGGYEIPKGCAILINLWSSHMDNDQWGDPENFRPERFLNEKGELRKMEGFLPFGAGKRSCLGESLARNNLFLFFSGILQNFSLTIPEGEDPPTTVPDEGVNLTPKPFRMQIVPRKDK